jgi:hypothetical protein
MKEEKKQVWECWEKYRTRKAAFSPLFLRVLEF